MFDFQEDYCFKVGLYNQQFQLNIFGRVGLTYRGGTEIGPLFIVGYVLIS